MAFQISNYTGALGTSADYPRGDIKDAPSGTLVNRTMLSDPLQFFQKLMAEAGITPNGLSDNTTNGWQLYEALLGAIAKGAPGDALGEWTDAGTSITFSVSGGGGSSITVDAADVLYNKFKVIGRTLLYSLAVQNATIAGPPTSIRFDIPSDITTTLGMAGFAHIGLPFVGFYNGAITLTAVTGGVGGADQITLTNSSGFVVGANNQSFSINIIAELTS